MTQTLSNPAEQESKYWKFGFLTISSLLIIIMPLLSKDFGMSGDEWLQLEYGQIIWDYFFKGDKQALDFTNKTQLQYQHLEYYGGLFDFPMAMLHHWLPAIPLMILRHFFNAVFGATMMIFTGLLARKLSGKWSVGLLALLFIIFSPRMFGESMNNPKDIPFAAGFIIGTYFMVSYLYSFPQKIWRNALGIAIGWGIAFGVRSAGGLLLGAYFIFFIALYYFFNGSFRETLRADSNKLLKRFILFFVLAILVGYAIGMSCWPWGLQSPISRPLESLQGMTNREAFLKVLFDGSYQMSNNMPWYYELQWIVISNPLVVIIGCGLFVVLAVTSWRKVNRYAVIILLFGAVFPLMYMIYKKSTVYDTWRHVFFVYPFWVIAASMGWNYISMHLKNQKLKLLAIVIPCLGLLPAIIWTVREHPNQYVYFNELVGGVKGAHGVYETDYYQNSGLQDAKWLLKNAIPVNGRKLLIASNMSGFEQYFAQDTARFTYYYVRFPERHQKEWDYYISTSRFISTHQLLNGKWPPANVVYTANADGIPLSAVIERKSNAGIEANEALKKNDFATAAQKYAEYVQADPSDENAMANYGIALASMGQLDAGIGALTRAAELDPTQPFYYETIAKIYEAKGDRQNAMNAMNKANSIRMAQEEEAE